MGIKHKTIVSSYFTFRINTFIEENGIRKDDIINITESRGFSTLWYWEEETIQHPWSIVDDR